MLGREFQLIWRKGFDGAAKRPAKAMPWLNFSWETFTGLAVE